ncbi:MAG: hypothetical protein HY866_20280 [Chloroflexi bacterium]|nr:hypothetical protein [Chloroflexota bacterium]
MTTYPDLDWNSLNFVRSHLYGRLVTPLTHALGCLAIAQHVPAVDNLEQHRRAGYSLELALNLIKAWSALIHVQSGQAIQEDQRRMITPGTLPGWLVDHLNTQTAFKAEHKHTIFVHAETFYETLILIAEIAAKAGTLKMLLVEDAKGETAGVWVRAVFDPPSSGAYTGLPALITRLDLQDPVERAMMMQLQVVQDLCAINRVCLRVQTNTHTGEQALAVQFSAAPARPAEFLPCGDPLQAIPTLDPAQEQPAAADSAPTPAPPVLTEAENAPETLIVPPLGLRESLLAMLMETQIPAAAQLQEGEKSTLTADHEPSPAAPDVSAEPYESAGIEYVAPQTASDTLIIPPLDLRRRLVEHQLAQELEEQTEGEQKQESDPAAPEEDKPADNAQ